MLLEKRHYFTTGLTRLHINDINANQQNPLTSLLSGKQLTIIYREGWLKQLYELNGTKWFIKPEVLRLCPNNMIIAPVLGNGPINLEFIHPVVSTLNKFRKHIKMNSVNFSYGWSSTNASSIPRAALSLLLNINAFDNNINYYLKKKGFLFLIAMIKLINRTQSKKDARNERASEIKNQLCMKDEDRLAKCVAKATKKQTAIVARREKATKKQTAIVARREKATKKQTAIIANLEKAIAKKAKTWGVILAKQDKIAKERVAQPRRYKLKIVA